MATAIRAGVISESPAEPCAWPAFESTHEDVCGARAKAAAARQTAGQLAAQTASHIRSHPVQSASVALAAGALLGSLVGFGLAWFARNRT